MRPRESLGSHRRRRSRRARALSGVLRDEGYEVEAVESGEACLERVTRAPYDVILLDIWLPGMDGLATLGAAARAAASTRRWS